MTSIEERLENLEKANIFFLQKIEELEKRLSAPSKEIPELQWKWYKKALLVFGPGTKPNRLKLKEIGGSWNSVLKGWIFLKSKRRKIIDTFPGIVQESV